MARGAATGDGDRVPAAAAEPPASPVAVVAPGDQHVVLGHGDEATFGRGDDVRLRIGDDIDDDLVAPVAGALFVQRARVIVANCGPHLALDIAVPGRPLRPLSPGDWHAPADPQFTVVVQGALRYELVVSSRVAGNGSAALPGGGPARDAGSALGAHLGDRPASGGRAGGLPELTSRQRAILDAYVAPMAEGLPPATHQQVADTVGCCRQTVRLESGKIVDAFLAAGVPMRDRRADRDAITDAWARHRL